MPDCFDGPAALVEAWGSAHRCCASAACDLARNCSGRDGTKRKAAYIATVNETLIDFESIAPLSSVCLAISTCSANGLVTSSCIR